MKRAVLVITAELLAKMLGIRSDVEIVDASFERESNLVAIHVRGDGLSDDFDAGEGSHEQQVDFDDISEPDSDSEA